VFIILETNGTNGIIIGNGELMIDYRKLVLLEGKKMVSIMNMLKTLPCILSQKISGIFIGSFPK
jgi:hypothetical protein